MNKPKILIVEDEALIAASLVQTLSSLGYTVQKPIVKGEDAINSVKLEKPDLILMDIELLGEMDGIEAAEKIREIVDIPIVYLTSYTDDLRFKQAQLTEPYGYIVKPAHGRALNATIDMAMFKHKLDQKLKDSEESLRQANKKLSLLSGITRHDISNKLAVINGLLNILEDEQFNPEINDYLSRISTAVHRISAMIRFTKEYESIGVNAPSWQECTKLVGTAAKQILLGQVLVENDLPSSIEVFADLLIEKVFYNLIDNAVRHGGKINNIHFSVQESGDNRLIICEDDGDGVPVEDKDEIFERGFGKNSGLGLTLAREILAITGMTIQETGEPGKGARFEITVPNGKWRFEPGY